MDSTHRSSAPPPDPLTAAVRAILAPIIADAVRTALAEHTADDAPRPELVDDAGMARALDISVATLRRMLPDGLPFIRCGEHRRYKISDVIAFLDARTRRREVTT